MPTRTSRDQGGLPWLSPDRERHQAPVGQQDRDRPHPAAQRSGRPAGRRRGPCRPRRPQRPGEPRCLGRGGGNGGRTRAGRGHPTAVGRGPGRHAGFPYLSGGGGRPGQGRRTETDPGRQTRRLGDEASRRRRSVPSTLPAACSGSPNCSTTRPASPTRRSRSMAIAKPGRSRPAGFRRWLARRYFDAEGKAPTAQALADAIGVLAGKALFEGPMHAVHVRLAAHDGDIYLDLGDDAWRVVEITAAGWHIATEPPVKFRRTRGMQPLPEPVAAAGRRSPADPPTSGPTTIGC